MGSAAKNRSAKKIKLQQVAQESKTISELFNKQTKPEPIDAQLIQPAVILQLDKLIEEQEYSVDYPDDYDRSVSLNIDQPDSFTNEDDTMDNMDVVPRSAVDVSIPTIEKQHMCDPVQLPINAFQENYDISLSKNDELVQPEMLFPATNGRRFTSRHKIYNWIEYCVSKDEIFCFPCRHFSANIIASGKTAGNLCFVIYGSKCKNWKEQTLSLNNHQRCKTHVICVQRWNDYLLVKKNHSLSIANQVNNVRQQNIIENREHLKFLLKATLFLSKQGLAFRGHDESDISKNKGNFLEMLDMFADDKIKLRLQARYGHYTSPEYQNDFISSIAQCTRQIILNSMNKFGVYTIMVDETKDLSKKEQMSFLIRFVDKELNICERSIGCYHMANSNAESLASKIIKILSINKLDIMNCIGQCYDGASVMSGQYSGVQERIRSKVPHAIYVHCYAHRLNLCLVQTLQNIPHLCNFFNTIQNLYKFLMNGQTRYELFVRAQKDKQIPVIHLERLVETRWAYWYKSIQKVNMRFTEILEVLLILSHQGDQTARAVGILSEISNISFIKTSHAMEILLQTIHCASVELQGASIIQSSAVNLLQNTKQNIQKMRNDTF